MTALEIRTLLRQLFQAGLFGPLHKAAGRRISLEALEQRAVIDPGFGGKLVRWFSEAGEPLPEFITHPALVRTSRFLLEPGSTDPDIKVALANALNLPGSEAQRDPLRAVLTCLSTTLESTAELLHIDLEVVSLFETLHWNVMDRKMDRPYIARLRGQLALPGAPPGNAPLRALLEIGHELDSPEAVLAATGVLALDPALIHTLLRRRRSECLASATVGLMKGQIVDQKNPGLRGVLRMIAARRKTKANTEVVTGPSISPAESVRLVLKQLQANPNKAQSTDPNTPATTST